MATNSCIGRKDETLQEDIVKAVNMARRRLALLVGNYTYCSVILAPNPPPPFLHMLVRAQNEDDGVISIMSSLQRQTLLLFMWSK